MPYLEPDPEIDVPSNGHDRRDGGGTPGRFRRIARDRVRSFRRLTLTEWGVIVAILGVLVGLLMPADGEFEWMRERRLARWKPGPYDEIPPKAPIRAPHARIEGLWLRREGRHGNSLEIVADAPATYRVGFHSYHLTLERTATFHDGVLSFDRPVEEVLPRTTILRKFFAIRVEGREYLVPAARVAAVEAMLSKDGGRIANDAGFKHNVYERYDRSPMNPLEPDLHPIGSK